MIEHVVTLLDSRDSKYSILFRRRDSLREWLPQSRANLRLCLEIRPALVFPARRQLNQRLVTSPAGTSTSTGDMWLINWAPHMMSVGTNVERTGMFRSPDAKKIQGTSIQVWCLADHAFFELRPVTSTEAPNLLVPANHVHDLSNDPKKISSDNARASSERSG